ncbi:MAG: pilus assembly protein PilP [Nitrospirae bacterium]|nr:pilus assembly protein PilP [Nitrospirota bacterium]
MTGERVRVRGNFRIKIFKAFYIALAVILLSSYGCKDKQPSTPGKAIKQQSATASGKEAADKQAQTAVQEAPPEGGYIYQPGDRRDPFDPLIVPSKKAEKRDTGKPGTLESYDISEFTLTAIAKKGDAYFALLVTPDNRSFTVKKGTVIGYNKGRVAEISKDKVVLEEHSKDVRGDSRPRQITLEFLKER